MKVLEEKEFKDAISKGVVLVDFFATWCGPCRMMASILEDIAKEVEEEAEVYKVDVDNAEEISRQYGILSIPTLIIFKDGEVVEKHVGVWQKDDCVSAINKAL